MAQVPYLGSLHAQAPGGPRIIEEIKKQQDIYQSQKFEGYVIDRSLYSYIETMPEKFIRSLANLDQKQRWLDIGAGEANAMLDYFTPKYDELRAKEYPLRSGKAGAVALSSEDRRTARLRHTAARLERNKIQYLFGRGFGEYSAQELGKFQVITDLLGGFSYTTHLTRYMERALAVMDPGGDLYAVLQDVQSENGGNKPFYAGAPYLTELTRADGKELKVCAWLKSISCVQVTCELRPEWKPPIEVYHVQKTCIDVNVPELLPLHFVAGTPPERGFQLKN